MEKDYETGDYTQAAIHFTRGYKSFRNDSVPGIILRDFMEEIPMSIGEFSRLAEVSKSRIYRARIPKSHLKGHRKCQPINRDIFFKVAKKINCLAVAERYWSRIGFYREVEYLNIN